MPENISTDAVDNAQILLQQRLQRALCKHGASDGIVVVLEAAAWTGDAEGREDRVLGGALKALIQRAGVGMRGVPVLACGLLRKAYLDGRVRTIGGRQLALWEWRGFAYVKYGFSEGQLVTTIRGIIEGAKMPLPPGLLPTAGDVLRLTSEIRHWLENRLRNTEGALNDFQRARLGEIQLHRTYLDPVAPVTEEHRAMLDRLWALEAPAGRFAPRTGGLGQLKAAVAEFERHWEALEAARAALRASGIKGEEQGLTETVAEFARVCDALQSAIKATRELDNEMTERKGN